MDSFTLVRGFASLEAAAAAVNALVAGGLEYGSIGMRAGGRVYLVIVEAADASERSHAERILSGMAGAAQRGPAAPARRGPEPA